MPRLLKTVLVVCSTFLLSYQNSKQIAEEVRRLYLSDSIYARRVEHVSEGLLSALIAELHVITHDE